MTDDSTAPGGVAIIGATSGIGQAMARFLSGEQVPLFIGARSDETLQACAEELGAGHQSVDASSEESLKSFLEAADQYLESLDGVVCCAGSIFLKPAHLTSLKDFRKTIDQNLTAAFLTVKHAVNVMKKDGSIVLFSTAAATAGIPNHEAIAAAKAGITGLTRSAAATYASRNIRVNCIAPGLTDSSMSSQLLGNEASRKASEAMHALGRIGNPEDFTEAIRWLLGKGSSWVSGETIHIDGGLSTLRPSPKSRG